MMGLDSLYQRLPIHAPEAAECAAESAGLSRASRKRAGAMTFAQYGASAFIAP
jgi:hypothetical protein